VHSYPARLPQAQRRVDACARALQQGERPSQLAHQDRYAVRSGACVTHKAKDLPAVMLERFGDATGFVGRPRTAAAE
jgi:phthalate 4,5-dioxygenase oxygenase subunit